MLVPSLTYQCCLGYATSPFPQITSFYDPESIIYLSSSNIVIENIETKVQKILPISEFVSTPDLLVLSPDSKLAAVCQRNRNQILIFDLFTWKKRRTLIAKDDWGTNKFMDVQFSCDSNSLYVLFGEEEVFYLSIWSVEKGKIIYRTIVQSSTRLMPHLTDANTAVLISPSAITTVKLVESEIQTNTIETEKEIQSVIWLKNTLLVGLKNGEVKELQNDKLLPLLKLEEKEFYLAPWKDGFAVFTPKQIYYYKSHAEEKFNIDKVVPFKQHYQNILKFQYSPDESRFLLALSNEVYILKSDTFAILKEISPPKGNFIDMDNCIRKNLLAICNADKTVRLWNYFKNQNELVKPFAEELFSIAMHPSGFQLLIGFSDKLRVFNIVNGDLILFKEFSIRSCRACCFANGGHLFAAVNGNTIQLYNFWTLDLIQTFKGHSGKIKSLSFSKDDLLLVSAGTDGAAYSWNLITQKRECENILKGCSYTSAVLSLDGRTLYCVGSDKMLREISESQIVQELGSEVVLTQVQISHQGKVLVTGTATGALRAYKYPLEVTGEYQEYRVHSSPVMKIKFSYDDQFVFVAGEDGSIVGLKLATNELEPNPVEQKVTDVVAVNKAELEEQKSVIKELKSQMEEMQIANEYQIRLKDMSFNEKSRDLNEKYSQEIESLKMTRASLLAKKEKEERLYEQELSALKEKNQKEMLQKESSYHQKLMAQYEKFQQLQIQVSAIKESMEERVREKEHLHRETLERVVEEFDQLVKQKETDLQHLQDELKQQSMEFEETIKQIEEDLDFEIQNTQSQYEKKLATSFAESLQIKGENAIMRKKFQTLQKDIDDGRGEVNRLLADQKRLQDFIHNLEKEIQILKKEVQNRDDFIQEKERKVFELKRSNQELEKHKYVLDHKIKDLRKQNEPKEHDISDMQQHINSLNKELEGYFAMNCKLEKYIQQLNENLIKMHQIKLVEKQKKKEMIKLIEEFKRELEQVMTFYQEEHPVLQKQLKKLLKKYIEERNEKPAVGSTESLMMDGSLQDLELVKLESERQRDYLLDSAAKLRKKVKDNAMVFMKDETDRIRENEEMISELGKMRLKMKKTKQYKVPQL